MQMEIGQLRARAESAERALRETANLIDMLQQRLHAVETWASSRAPSSGVPLSQQRPQGDVRPQIYLDGGPARYVPRETRLDSARPVHIEPSPLRRRPL